MSPVPKADHLRTELISDALTNAIATRDPKADVVFHSAAASAAFAELARDHDPALGGIGRSMLGQRPRRELIASLKGECLDTRTWATRPTPAGPSSSTSAGSTAAVCTAHWAT